jgi:hypothetical protein
MYGRIRNVVGRDLSMGGYKTIISNVRTTSFRLNGGDTKVTPFGETVRMGYNVLRDAVIEKESFEDGNGLIVTDSTNSVFNVRISAQNMEPDYTSRFGLTRIEPNVTIGHLIREDLEVFFPNMLPENFSAPLGEVSAYLEEKANVSWTGELDGTYKYKLGVLVSGHETREVIVPDSLVITYDSSSTTGSRIVIRGWRDLDNGRFYQEFNLYRYSSAAATEPDHVYRIRKLGRDAASSDFDVRDEGDRIVALSSGNYYGYPQAEIDGTTLVYFPVSDWTGRAGEYVPRPSAAVTVVQENTGVITVKKSGGDYDNLTDALTRACVLVGQGIEPIIQVFPGTYVGQYTVTCPGVTIQGVGTPNQICLESSGTAGPVLTVTASRFSLSTMEIRFEGNAPETSMIVAHPSIDSLSFVDLTFTIGGNRVERFIDLQAAQYTQATLRGITGSGGSGSGANGGVVGKPGVLYQNLTITSEFALRTSTGGKFVECKFLGRNEITQGEFVNCIFGAPTEESYTLVHGGAEFTSCTFAGLMSQDPVLALKNGSSRFDGCTAINTYLGSSGQSVTVSVEGGSPTWVGGTIVHADNDAGSENHYALGSKGQVQRTIEVRGVAVTGGIDRTFLTVAGPVLELPLTATRPTFESQGGYLDYPGGLVFLPVAYTESRSVSGVATYDLTFTHNLNSTDYTVVPSVRLVSGTYQPGVESYESNHTANSTTWRTIGLNDQASYEIRITIIRK